MEHTILREGEWSHSKAPGGKLAIDAAMLGELEKNFRAGVGLAADKMPFHVGHTEHRDDRAAAWAGVRVEEDPDRPGKRRMVALARYTTPDDYEKVRTGQYGFVSPTIDFGYRDAEGGKNYSAVLRNVALTNYPYLKKMGPAKVVNLSEIAGAEGDQDAVRRIALAAANPGGVWDSGGGTNGDPNPDGLPDGYDLTKLPNQCRTCARLGNDCPFSDDEKDQDLALKTAAAGAGNCPQYVESDGQTPGGGGAADAAIQSPAVSRSQGTGKSARVPMSETPKSAKTTTKPRSLTMTEAQIKKLQDQVETTRREKHDAFIAQLSETHHLPADALTTVKEIFDGGHKASLALSEALEGQTVALSDNEEFALPEKVTKELARVDLSDSVMISRDALRELLTSVAESTRTQLSEGETQTVDGKPPTTAQNGTAALSEFANLSPTETIKKVNEAAAAGKI